MTREEREIIEAIKSMGYDRTDYPREKVNAVINMAIETLSKPSGDLIRRADAIKTIHRYKHRLEGRGQTYGFLLEEFENRIPSADAVSREVYEKRTQTDERIIDSYRREFAEVAEVASADAVQRWIPCSERLPSEGEVVLASWSCLWKGAIVLARRYEGKWEWAYEHGADYWQPTELEEYWPEAWMPLPEPYEPKTERRG